MKVKEILRVQNQRGVQKLELSIGTEACVCPRALTDFRNVEPRIVEATRRVKS